MSISLPKLSQDETEGARSQGFTLIEMMVVMGIIALMGAMIMPSVSSYFSLSLNSATRDLATTTKEAFNSTVVTGKVHRLVYDLKENSFWVESGPPGTLMDTKESKEKEERKRRFGSQLSDKQAPQSEFKMEPSVTRRAVKLPRSVIYEDVVTQYSSEPQIEGRAYTHFFPHGLTEQTIIHLKDSSNHHASLVISPIIGTTDVYDRYINAMEVFEKQ